MIPLAILYGLATLLSGFVGFRDAAGRNGHIEKSKYYQRSVLRAILLEQVLLGLIGVIGWLAVGSQGLALLAPAAWRAAAVYLPYTAVVLLAFLPYAVPHWEVRSLVTVAVLGPLTLLQPVVVVLGWLAAIAPISGDVPQLIFFSLAAGQVLLLESLLGWLGWSAKEAIRSTP